MRLSFYWKGSWWLRNSIEKVELWFHYERGGLTRWELQGPGWAWRRIRSQWAAQSRSSWSSFPEHHQSISKRKCWSIHASFDRRLRDVLSDLFVSSLCVIKKEGECQLSHNCFLVLKKSLLSSPTQYRMLIQPSIVTHCREMMIKVPLPGFDKYILLDMPSPINEYRCQSVGQ